MIDKHIDLNDFDVAWKSLKAEIWKERWGFVRLVILILAFLAGIGVEHYFSSLIYWLW